MKFARTITLDESDSRIFDHVAQPGEWAISGTFEFSNWTVNLVICSSGSSKRANRATFRTSSELILLIIHSRKLDKS